MRQNKYLIKEAKQNTNTTDAEAISDALCIRLLNRAQDYIQAYLFTKNIKSKIFRGQVNFNFTPGIDIYQLPFNVYARNSINNVMYRQENYYCPLPQIAEKARGTTRGYFTSDDKIIFSQMPQNPTSMFISYTKKMPGLGESYGKIVTINTDVSIVLASGGKDMTDVDDFFSVVDSNGVIVSYNNPVDQTGLTILMDNTTNVEVGMYVVPGYYSTTHCQLPDELESPLILALEKMIDARLSSTDLPIAKAFSDETLNMIGDMYSDNATDTFMPPVLEYSEWV